MNEALAALMTAAALVGAPLPRVSTPPAAPARCAAGETIVLTKPLADIAAKQARAFVSRAFGAAVLEAAASFDDQGALWIKFRQGAWTAAFSEEALRSGRTVSFPSGTATLRFDHDVLRASSGRARAEFDKMALVDRLYASAFRVKLGIQPYAVLLEDGSAVPASLSLLRREAPGAYFVSYHSLGELAQTQWIMATGGLIYGIRFSGPDLVFVSKPLPPIAAR